MKRLAAALLLLAQPALAQSPCPFPGQAPHLVVQLFFGQSIKDQGLISRRFAQRRVGIVSTTACAVF